jgi:hypothetical protein
MIELRPDDFKEDVRGGKATMGVVSVVPSVTVFGLPPKGSERTGLSSDFSPLISREVKMRPSVLERCFI